MWTEKESNSKPLEIVVVSGFEHIVEEQSQDYVALVTKRNGRNSVPEPQHVVQLLNSSKPDGVLCVTSFKIHPSPIEGYDFHLISEQRDTAHFPMALEAIELCDEIDFLEFRNPHEATAALNEQLSRAASRG